MLRPRRTDRRPAPRRRAARAVRSRYLAQRSQFPTRGISVKGRYRPLWLGLLVFTIATLLRVLPAVRQDLWADELFSLAVATGHSLEHPAAAAVPALGDFAEPSGGVPAASFQRYLEHESPA